MSTPTLESLLRIVSLHPDFKAEVTPCGQGVRIFVPVMFIPRVFCGRWGFDYIDAFNVHEVFMALGYHN